VVSWSFLGALVGGAAVCAGLATFVGRFERRQRDLACAQMPEVLRSFAATLGAGKSLAQSIDHVGSTVGEPLGSEFLRVSFEIRGGRAVCEAVDDLAARLDVPGLALLGAALQISQRTGAPLGELLERTTRMVGETVGMRRELVAKTSQVRLSANVVAALPVVLVGVLTLMSPDYRAGLALAAGRACLCAAALLDIAALVLVKRIMAGVLG
jgi:tight adherence protein B